MKLIRINYMTSTGEKKLNSYNVNIPRKIVEESGINDKKKLVAIAKDKEIIIKEK